MEGHLRYIIQKLIKATCGNLVLGNVWNKNTLEVEEYGGNRSFCTLVVSYLLKIYF